MLVGSALGYYGGGALADVTRSRRVVPLLVCGGVFFALTVPFVRGVIPVIHETLPYQWALFLSACIVLLPVSVCVSALITYVIRLFVDTLASIGQVHGDLYTIATLGSICAVFLTSYYLIPMFPIPHIFYGLGLLLGISGLLYIRTSKLLKVVELRK